MSDALPCNTPSKQHEIISSLCNSHARCQFVDVISHFPEDVEWLLERYGEIWTREEEAHALTAADRLAYRSLPVNCGPGARRSSMTARWRRTAA